MRPVSLSLQSRHLKQLGSSPFASSGFRQDMMMKVLLAAADFQDGRVASEFVETWLHPAKRVVHVVHVVEQSDVLRDLARTIFTDWKKQALDRARGLVDRLAAPLSSPRSRARGLVLQGNAKRTLLQLISDRRIDLTVVAPYASSRAKQFLLGSVSETILHDSPTSVAIARARPRRRNRPTVLIGLDGSASAQKAAKWVLSHMAPRCRVSLVYAEEPPDTLLDRMARISTAISPRLERAQKARSRRAGRYLERVGRLLRAQGHAVNIWIKEGPAATQILDVAERNNADLIVLGSRGLGTFDRYTLGSVSNKVARFAGCSVVIVK
jgi:nucleotide-binding universal stress UspA family protein